MYASISVCFLGIGLKGESDDDSIAGWVSDPLEMFVAGKRGSYQLGNAQLSPCVAPDQGDPHDPHSIVIGIPSPFFPGILLSTKPPKTLEKQLVFEKHMVENNGIEINP